MLYYFTCVPKLKLKHSLSHIQWIMHWHKKKTNFLRKKKEKYFSLTWYFLTALSSLVGNYSVNSMNQLETTWLDIVSVQGNVAQVNSCERISSPSEVEIISRLGGLGIHNFAKWTPDSFSFVRLFSAGVTLSLSFFLFSAIAPFDGRLSIARRLILRVRSLARAKKPIRREEIKASMCMRGTSLRAFALPDRFNRAARGSASIPSSVTIVDFKADSHRQPELINPATCAALAQIMGASWPFWVSTQF